MTVQTLKVPSGALIIAVQHEHGGMEHISTVYRGADDTFAREMEARWQDRCTRGLSFYQGMAEEAGLEEAHRVLVHGCIRPGRVHSFETLRRCTACGWQERA